MDIVIPFQHSINKDHELLMTLRTIERNLPGADHVWVIGDTPRWSFNASNLTVIPFIDIYREECFRDRNIANKMLKACSASDIPEVFLLAHDDNFIMAPCDIENWPAYYRTTWGTSQADINTQTLFGTRKNFDLHCPHIMTKKGIHSSLRQLDWSKEGGYGTKTAYCIGNGIEGEFYIDLKIKHDVSTLEVDKLITAGRRFFSSGDRAYSTGIKPWLNQKFPEKSKYEA